MEPALEPEPIPAAPVRSALVLGLGESGLAMAAWLAGDGWNVRVADTRAAPPMLAALQAQLPAVRFAGGAFEHALLDGVELVALSPGLSPHQEPLRALLHEARARGIESVGEIELFARALAHLAAERGYAPRVIGITGTNGKTTTARMVAQMIATGGRRVALAGNISPSALDALRAALDADALPQYWVLELSSFQLAGTRSLQCWAAAVLNVTQDHLDWHPDFDDYRAAKLGIFAPQTYRVVNRDDPLTQPATAGESSSASFGSGAKMPSLAAR